MSRRLRIEHATRFEYERPVRETVMELRMEPASTAAQRLLRFGLDVLPKGPVSSYVDGFGNTVHHLERPESLDVLALVATSEIETGGPPDPAPPGPPPLDMLRFGGPVKDIPAIRRLAGAPAQLADPEGYLESLTKRVSRWLRYEKGATTVHSDVSEVLGLRAGVCQDFAHVLIACCRAAGIPARYVSGYVYEGEGAAHESHAWTEAWVPGAGWLGFDATHPARVGSGHVKVAVGGDYTECAPTRGVFVGDGGASLMTATVSLTMLPAPGAGAGRKRAAGSADVLPD